MLPKNREIVYLGKGNIIRRQVLEDGVVPTAANSTITKVELVLADGSARFSFNSTDNAGVVTTPDVDWIVDLDLGAEDIPADDYTANLVLFDADNVDGIVVQSFPLRVTSV